MVIDDVNDMIGFRKKILVRNNPNRTNIYQRNSSSGMICIQNQRTDIDADEAYFLSEVLSAIKIYY